MKFHPYGIIFALMIYLPSEDFILKWLPVSDRIYSYSRFFSELLIYSLLVVVLFNRIFNGLSLRRTPIDVPLLFFVSVGLLSIVLNNAPLIAGLVGIRTLIRYVAMYYIMVNLNMNSNHVRKLIFIMLFIGIGESLIAWAQHFMGISSFWLPRATDLEIAGYTKGFTVLSGGIEQGAAIGTLGHSVNMALYLLIAIIIILSFIYGNNLSKNKKVLLFIGFFIIYSGILFTYSRGVALAAILAIPLILVFMHKKRTLAKFLVLGFMFMIILVSFSFMNNQRIGTEYKQVKKEYVNPVDNIRMIFSSEYIERTEGSRQWILKEVGVTILKSFTLIGYSPDEFTAREKIVKVSGGTLSKLIRYKAFEDVYWVAIFAYFGIIGASLYVLILYKLYKCSKFVLKKSEDHIFTIVAVSTATLIILTFLLTFLTRTFEFRPFSFHFWLLAGLIMNEYLRLDVKNKLNKKVKR